MSEYNQQSILANPDKFQFLIKNVSSRVNTMKARQLLKAAITKMTKELSYIEDKLDVAQTEDEIVSNQLAKVQDIIAQPQMKLDALKIEKESVEKSFETSGLYEKEIEEKSRQLEAIKLRIGGIREDTTILKLTFKEYDLQQKRMQDQGQELKKESLFIKDQVAALQSDIHVKKRISALLTEILAKDPDGNDSSDIEAVFLKYMQETHVEVDKISNEITAMSQSIAVKQKEEQTLVPEKEQLEKQVMALIAEIGNTVDVSVLEETVRKQKLEEASLLKSNEQMLKKINELEAEITRVDKKIANEKKIEKDSTHRYEYLLSIKQKMDALSNVEDEIQRLKNETDHYQKETLINRTVLDVCESVNKELTPSHEAMQASVSFYEKELSLLTENIEKAVA
ncbi:MAG: hypothetical protein HQK75_19355 [Candidatus Magnetomorum sp.]|nr:hypothetical protein [Candidatus Magnetomorum sp.]